jgi:hypothetical protein
MQNWALAQDRKFSPLSAVLIGDDVDHVTGFEKSAFCRTMAWPSLLTAAQNVAVGQEIPIS